MNDEYRPQLADLLDWIEGRLDPVSASAVEAFAAADRATARDLRWFRDLIETARAFEAETPPGAVERGARQAFRDYAHGRRPAGLLRRLTATLADLGGPKPAFAGVRGGAGRDPEHPYVYSCEGTDVVLSIDRDRERLDLVGQVFGQVLSVAPAESTSVQLLQDGIESSITTVSDLGEFRFEGIAAGSYEVVITSSSFEILIPSFEAT